MLTALRDDVFQAGRFMSERALRIRATSIERWSENRSVELVGLSDPFLTLLGKIEKCARYREPVLITGESGVGKEWIAQSIYLLGTQPGRPYVPVNCPQHQDANLSVSELFGHTKGSFTGAIADHKGAFEEADGGVIFLDEVGDLHLTAQAMLLRTLSTGDFKPLGATFAKTTKVRVVAATNQPLNALVLTKQFRYDLLFRLWYFHLQVPPLRDRGDDWRLLVDYGLLQLTRRYGVEKRFSDASIAMLERFHWPGNVRQLMSLVTMGYAMAEGTTIEPEDFASEMSKPYTDTGEPAVATTIATAWTGDGTLGADNGDLYARLTSAGADFWKVVYEPFMDRELNREQVRAVVRQGLAHSANNYRNLLRTFRLPPDDYERFTSFLRHHRLKPDA